MNSAFLKPDFIWHGDTDAVAGINRIAEMSHAMALKKGWWEKYKDSRGRLALTPEVLLSKMMLAVGEVAEASEEVRDGQHEIRFEHPDKGIKYALSHDWAELRNGFKPEGMGVEIADAIIRLLDIAYAAHLDIGYAIAVKMYFNQFRQHRHGGRLA